MTGRASPDYQDYRRPLPPQESYVPRRQEGSSTRYGGGDMMESRRAKRDATVVNIWPPSPKSSSRDLSPKRGKSSKSKRRRSVQSDSSEEEHRRRKERKDKKKKGDHKSRIPYDSDSESDRRSRSRTRDRRSRDRSPSRSAGPVEDEWVVKSVPPPPIPSFSSTNNSLPPPSIPLDDGESDDELGPQPLHKPNTSKRLDERSYGGSLLRGEGSAMAAFLQDGTEARIPRRGEIGLTSDEIAKYEDVGYVMSGSRHRRMNAVRMRKENQVISAEEKRGILKLQKEEMERREMILREEFSELVQERLKGVETKT